METPLPARRKRRITRRLRVALLICAAVVVTIPVIVFFTAEKVMQRQEDLSDRLISSMARSADLNAALIRLADDIDNLNLVDNPADVDAASASALKRLQALREDFVAYQGRIEAQKIADLLTAYKRVLAEVAGDRIVQLQRLERIEDLRGIIQGQLRRTKTELLSTIAMETARFGRSMQDTTQPGPLGQGTGGPPVFSDLSLYRALTRLLDDIEERLADIDPMGVPGDTDDIAAKLRFLTRGMATRIANIDESELRKSLAQGALTLDRALLGPEGILGNYENYLMRDADRERIAAAQSGIAAQLLDHSDSLIQSSKADALQGSRDIANLIRENRLRVLGLSGLLLLVLFGLLFYIVGRRFSRRITILTDTVLEIARGDLDRKIDIGGDDELTAMGDALHVFRANRRSLVAVNAELESSNREVREVGARLQTVLDTATSGIIAFDHEGDVIMANRPARSFLGGITRPTPFEWPAGINFLDGEDLSALEASKNPIMRALVGQQIDSEIALMACSPGGDVRYMRISSSTVENEPSSVRCVVVLDDVSEAEKNRQTVERAGRLDALGQLTGGIAHDFNNLLATIQYALELSLDGGVSQQAEEYLKTAIGSVRRGSNLTARLLSFAKRQPGLARSQNVTEFIKEFRGLVEPSIEEAVSLNFEAVDPSLYVHCDGAQLENALLNLVLNSRDAILDSGKGDRITVSVREVVKPAAEAVPTDGMVSEGAKEGSIRSIEFCVTDNGPGMTPEIQRRALDPFFTTKKTNSGTGLGLSMVYGFAVHADGELRLYSEEGHGTTVRLLLPSGTKEGNREGAVLERPGERGRGERILLVEDDPPLRQIMADLVGSLGYEVHAAGSGQEALGLVHRGMECDVLLTDIVMPGGIDGFALGARVRAIRPDMGIVYMSGYTGFTQAEMGTAIGRFVQKPCTPSELSTAIVAALHSLDPMVSD